MKFATILPILIGGATTVGALKYLQSPPREKPTYYAALAPIPLNHPVEPQFVALREWTQSQPLPTEYIAEPRQIFPSNGKQFLPRFSRRPIVAGAPITEADLWPLGVNSLMMARLRDDPDMRAVPVKVDAVSGGGGFIQPGHRVDVLATVPDSARARNERRAKIILHGVEVLAVNQSDTPPATAERERGKTREEPPRYVILLLSLGQAERLKAVETMRETSLQLLLSAENAEPHQTFGASVADAMGVQHDPAPPAPAPVVVPAAAARPAGPAPYAVEIWRGKQKNEQRFRRKNGVWVPVAQSEAAETPTSSSLRPEPSAVALSPE